jgi:hypothetical protein
MCARPVSSCASTNGLRSFCIIGDDRDVGGRGAIEDNPQHGDIFNDKRKRRTARIVEGAINRVDGRIIVGVVVLRYCLLLRTVSVCVWKVCDFMKCTNFELFD